MLSGSSSLMDPTMQHLFIWTAPCPVQPVFTACGSRSQSVRQAAHHLTPQDRPCELACKCTWARSLPAALQPGGTLLPAVTGNPGEAGPGLGCKRHVQSRGVWPTSQ